MSMPSSSSFPGARSVFCAEGSLKRGRTRWKLEYSGDCGPTKGHIMSSSNLKKCRSLMLLNLPSFAHTSTIYRGRETRRHPKIFQASLTPQASWTIQGKWTPQVKWTLQTLAQYQLSKYSSTVRRDKEESHGTIGYGHKLSPGKNMEEVTKEQALVLLREVIIEATTEIKSDYDTEVIENMGEPRLAALIDIAVQLGSVNWPNLKKALKATDYKQAAHQIMVSKYGKQKQSRARAKRNANIMQTGKMRINKDWEQTAREILVLKCTRQTEVEAKKESLFLQVGAIQSNE